MNCLARITPAALAFGIALLGVVPAVLAINIIDFNVTAPDARFPGAADSDHSGQNVLLADVDGNGLDDIVIGAPGVDFSGRSGCGAIYIYLATGAVSGTIALDANDSNLKRIFGSEVNGSVGAILAAGDVNNDNRMDIVCGVPAATLGAKFQAGKVFVILGSATPPDTIDLASPDPLVIEIQGADTFHKLGTSVAVGDVNDDGFGDVLAGAPFATAPAGAFTGRVFVLPGSASPAALVDLASPPAGVITINGAHSNDTFGTACYAADVNNDMIDDIIVGAPQAPAMGRASAGVAYLIPGGGTLGATINAGDGAAAGISQMFGATANDLAGSRFCVGDVNGDTFNDLMVAAPEYNGGGRSNAGGVFILAGTSTWPDTIDFAGGTMTRIDGPAVNAKIGLTMSVGDLNMDGFGDLVIGSPLSTPLAGRDEAGAAFAVFGRNFPQAAIDLAVDQTGLTQIFGAKKNDHAGRSVATGFIDNDPFADLLIGADNVASGSDLAVGESYVVYGSPAITPTGLQYFAAAGAGGRVRIDWILVDEVPVEMFDVRREGHDGPKQLSPSIIELASLNHYLLLDTDVRAGETYLYTVRITGDGDQVLFSTSVSVTAEVASLKLRNHPNPFRSATTIAFDLPAPGRAEVSVFDVSGARVATLADRTFAPGTAEVSWDGTNRAGVPAASGVYFVRVRFEGRSYLQKVQLVR